jgi:Ca2+-binding RTX toxin-like protein
MTKSLAAVAAVVLVGTVLATPAPAVAGPLPGGSVEVDFAGNLDFDGAPGFVNEVTVTKSGTTVTLDDIHAITVLGACVHPLPADLTVARCTVSPASPDLTIEPGDLGDTVVIIGGGSVNWLVGPGDGNDTVDLTGSDTGAVVAGGNGDDLIASSAHGETIDGDGGRDTVSYASHPGPVTVNLAAGTGGPESDNLTAIENVIGSPRADTLLGDAAANTLTGGPGNDRLNGVGGDDTLVGGAGADVMAGGTGADTASYTGHKTAVNASLDGLANDGAAGEADTIGADTENLMGGFGADVLYGNAARNVLHGDPVGDWLPASGGNDTIYPLGGHDASYGLGGDDTIVDSWGYDSIDGGFGNDALSGGDDGDTLYGREGSDVLHGGGGYDTVDGGPQGDWCYTDAGGGSKLNCELPLVALG